MTPALYIDEIECRRLLEQDRLDKQKTPAERNILGQFATPGPLACDIARYALSLRENDGPVRFLDPAIGTGAFLSALLKSSPGRLECAWGVEVDRSFGEIAERLWMDVPLRVLPEDFTKVECPLPQGFDLLMANPPYVRHHHLAPSDKLRLGALASRIVDARVSGLSGLYCYFMLLAHRWMSPGGIAAWLVPSEFMDVNYGECLRRYLTTRVTLVRLHQFPAADVQFDDAMVSSSVVFFRNRPPCQDDVVQFSSGNNLSGAEKQVEIDLSDLAKVRKWSSIFSDRRSRRAPTSEWRLTLSHLFRISRGIATGANGFFIVKRDEALAKGFDDRFLKPILPAARRITTSVIEADASGYPLIHPQFALIDSDLPPDELQIACPSLWDYLNQGALAGICASYLVQRRSPWYKQERRAPAPFICTYMGRNKENGCAFRFFWNRSKAVAPNTYLLLYPQGQLKTALQQDSSAARKVFEFLESLQHAGLNQKGRVYGGGLFKMEPRELGDVDANDLAESLGLVVHTQAAIEF